MTGVAADGTGAPREPRHDFARLEALFHEALDLPDGADLAAWLDARVPDTAIRAELVSLLEAHGARVSADDRARQHATRVPTARYGPYLAVAPLGRGGMSMVYRAKRVDGQFDDTVALKVLSPLFQAPEFLRRFERERQLLATLRHHHVATLIDGGVSTEGEPYLITELIEGLPLDRHADARHLNLRARLALLRQVCEAVEYAHRRQVVHGDLKPANILVNPQGLVKLLDFGTARLLASNDQATATNERMLTPRYASPEQLRGERITIASDIYSIGVLAYELLTGASPFGAAPSVADGLARAAGTLRLQAPGAAVTSDAAAARSSTPADLRAALYGPLTAALARAMAFDAADRFTSAAAFADALADGIVTGATTRAVAAASSRPATFVGAGSPRRWPPVLGWVLLATLVGVSTVAVASLSRANTTPAGVNTAAPAVTVAVLPMANDTGDPALDPFIDVLADDMAEALTRVASVRVTARTSTLAFRSAPRDLRVVGQALGVRHVIEGDVSRADDQLRVTLRALRTSDAQLVWTAIYTTSAAGMFTVAQTAAGEVLRAIDGGIEVAAVRSDQTTPRDPAARDAYARGRYFVRQATPASLQAGLEAFETCLRIEPEFGRCHSGWGHARSNLIAAQGSPSPADVRDAERATERAVELEPGNATAQANLGGFDILYRYDWPAARTKYLRAVQVSPRLSLEAYAGGLALVGRLDDAVALFRRALEWDPLSLALHFKLAGVLSAQGRIDDALAEYAVADTIAPNHPSTLYGRTMLYLMVGDVEKSRAALAAFRAAVPGIPGVTVADIIVQANTGREADARALLQSFEAGVGQHLPFLVAVCHAQLKQPAEAVRWLLIAIDRHDPAASSLVFETGLEPIRGAPEFRAVWDAVPKLTLEAPYPGGAALSRPR